MNELAIPFGLLHGRLVEPTEVSRGLACGCACPKCHAPLVARKGEKRRDYFAHHSSDSACGGGAETAAHLMAKQILADEERLLLPCLMITENGADSRGKLHKASQVLAEQRMAKASHVELEQLHGDIGKPDALFHEENGSTILVEFHATNPVDEPKAAKVQARDLAMLEINLWAFGRETATDVVALRQLVLDEPSNREWLAFPGYEAAAHNVAKSLGKKIAAADDNYRELERRAMAMTVRQSSSTTLYGPGPGKWLVCESCREIFQPPDAAIRTYQATVECPHCGFPVSTASTDPRR